MAAESRLENAAPTSFRIFFDVLFDINPAVRNDDEIKLTTLPTSRTSGRKREDPLERRLGMYSVPSKRQSSEEQAMLQLWTRPEDDGTRHDNLEHRRRLDLPQRKLSRFRIQKVESMSNV